MIIQELENLFSENPLPKEGNKITKDILFCIDKIVAETVEENFSIEVFEIYKKFIQMKDNAPENMKENVFSLIRRLAKDCFINSKMTEAALLYRFLAVKSILIPEDYSFIAEILVKDYPAFGSELIEIYQEKETNPQLKYLTCANFYNFRLQNYEKAIYNYEEYIKIDNTKPVIYSILGNLYAKLYGDKSLEKQVEYYEYAFKLKPEDSYILHGLAFGYEKLKNFELADKYYKELLKNNPTSTDYYNYGSFLIHNGDFKQGHKYFTKRFEIDDINFKYPSNIDKKWNFSDISDSLLVHFEQGFGDTIMYCRFLPEIKKYAKKVIFVVQNELYTLIKNSKLISEGIEIVAQKDEADIEYGVNTALLDLPYALGTTTDSIPFADGYLEVNEKDIKDYAKKYIDNSDKIKIGIAYSGDNNANYNSRNIPEEKFNILKSDKIQIYSFQKDEQSSEFINLGQTFDNFYTTACALKNMDIIISTDNVILNLAGALGIKTIGLYNYQTNYRWFKIQNNENVRWYSNVTAFQNDETDNWDSCFNQIKRNILN